MNRFITRRDEPFAGKEKLVVNICWHGINSLVTIERADLRSFYPYCPRGVISPWRASKLGLPTSSGFSAQCVK